MIYFPQRITAPFRAEIVGSFVRHSRLTEARDKFEAGLITAADLEAVEDEEIEKLVLKLYDMGLEVATDGEFRRGRWNLDFFAGLNGLEKINMPDGSKALRMTDRISFNPQHPFIRHFAFLKSVTPLGMSPRQSLPAPAQLLAELSRHCAEAIKALYSSNDDLMKDIAEAYHQTIIALYNCGCRNIMLDDRTWGMFGAAAADDSDAIGRQNSYVSLNNMAISGLPADLIVGTHICHGDCHGSERVKDNYSAVAPTLFKNENVKAFYLEFDGNDFSQLASLPSNKYMVLGLISTTNPELEDRRKIVDAINRASEYVPLEHLCLSPKCGFAPVQGMSALTIEQQWAKIKLLQEIADQVW